MLNCFVSFFLCRSEGDEGRAEQWVEVISWEPRAFVYHNFLVSSFFFFFWFSTIELRNANNFDPLMCFSLFILIQSWRFLEWNPLSLASYFDFWETWRLFVISAGIIDWLRFLKVNLIYYWLLWIILKYLSQEQQYNWLLGLGVLFVCMCG